MYPHRALIPFSLVLLLPAFTWAGHGITPLPDRPPAPPLELKDLNDQRYRLSDYHGHVLLVNFWATWCPPCRKEMPSMQRAWEVLKKEGIQFLAVNVGEDEERVFSFLGEYPVDFPLLLDQDSRTIERWPVRGLPTTFIIDPQGRIAYRAIGGRAWDDAFFLDLMRHLKKP